MEFFKEIEDLKEEVKNLKRLLQRIVCPAEVVEVDENLHRVRVKLLDRQGMITGFLPVLVPFGKDTYAYGLPKVGDSVLVVFLPQGLEDGFVLGSFYHLEKTPPKAGVGKFYKKFKGGTLIEYDENAHLLTVSVNGKAVITTQLTTHNGDVVINGNLKVSGNITAGKDIADWNGTKGTIATLRNTYNNHTHMGDSGGETSTPNQKVGG
jgi:phage baseplate assembly protein V